VEQDLNRIRAEMARVGNNMTLMGNQASAATLIQEPTTAPQATADDLVAMSRAYRRVAALYEAGQKLIASEFDLSKRLADALDTAIEVMEAERGFVLLRDEGSGGLQVMLAREMGRHLEASSPSMGIAGRAAIDGEPVLMNEQDDEFAGRESIITQRIASAMCVPLQVEGRILGSIYLDTRRPDKKFTTEDLELFSSLAAQSAVAIENVQLYERMVEAEKKRANLGRFLSPGVVETVMAQESELQLGGQKRVVATLFADIRGFTPLSERLPATELVDLLNEHFTAMTDIVFEHQGTLDKYNGDEVMALFGAPIGAGDDARRAVLAGLAMQEQCEALNIKRAAEGKPRVTVGIGIDTGEVIAGYIGSPKRLDFTVVGDHVNTARRFCSLAEPGQVVVGESTYKAVKDLVKVRVIGTVMLKGKETPVQAYEIMRLND
jgi:adenylate cyclase